MHPGTVGAAPYSLPCVDVNQDAIAVYCYVLRQRSHNIPNKEV